MMLETIVYYLAIFAGCAGLNRLGREREEREVGEAWDKVRTVAREEIAAAAAGKSGENA